MPDLVVVVTEQWMTIDGPLPEGYRLIVHNHTGDVDYYPHMEEVDECRYTSAGEDIDEDETEEGVPCYRYIEASPTSM